MSDDIEIVRYTKRGFSAREVMPTDAAKARAKTQPLVGDRWVESLANAWLHVDDVTADSILYRLYVPPCDITPSQAHETKRVSREEFEELASHRSYDGNKQWAADIAEEAARDDAPKTS